MSKIKDAYAFYYEYVKPLYCEIEAKDNTLPVELLFEIHAAFDHLRRHYVNAEDESTSASKAISHLKRGALDAFKLKLKYFHEDTENLLKSPVDFDLVDNGCFLPGLLTDKNKIAVLAKSSRLSESADNPDEAFTLWSDTSIAIDEFYSKYLADYNKIEWAKKKTFRWLNKDTWRGILVGFVTGCASSWLIWLLTSPTSN